MNEKLPIQKVRAEIATVLPPSYAGDLTMLPEEGLRRLHAKHLIEPPVRRTLRITRRKRA